MAITLVGITPAHAGKTNHQSDAFRPPRDHPRVCGENSPVPAAWRHKSGSPPRVRGKLLEFALGYIEIGITSACAGKTCPFPFSVPRWRDHPRVCGENEAKMNSADTYMGSPPRVRGNRSAAGKQRVSCGITPAHAGKTARSAWRFTAVRDHPRACGKTYGCKLKKLQLQGSPPRMRENLEGHGAGRQIAESPPRMRGKPGP